MYYLPLPCLRSYIFVATFLTFSIGVSCSVVSIIIFDNFFLLAEASDLNKNLSYVLFCLGIVLFLIGFAGLYGTWNKHAASVVIYQCGSLLYALIFFLIG